MLSKPTCLALALLSAPAFAQAYTAPRNAMGQPDLQGLWTNATITVLERDTKGAALVLSPEDAARLERADPAAPAPDGQTTTEFASKVMRINGEARSSFLVAPVDGKLPEVAPEALAIRAARPHPRSGPDYGRNDNPESLTLAERCLRDFGSSSGPPMMPVGYNNTYQVVQTEDHVMILVEMIHDARIVPLTKDRKRPAAIRQWMGDSIGWYEGDTLVVETRNFKPGFGFRGVEAPITERFRRIGESQILYAFEINDPKAFTAPIKAEIAMNAVPGPLFEYACHEGNYAMGYMLAGERKADVEAAKAAAKR